MDFGKHGEDEVIVRVNDFGAQPADQVPANSKPSLENRKSVSLNAY